MHSKDIVKDQHGNVPPSLTPLNLEAMYHFLFVMRLQICFDTIASNHYKFSDRLIYQLDEDCIERKSIAKYFVEPWVPDLPAVPLPLQGPANSAVKLLITLC